MTVLNKAADICWPMAKNDPGVKSAMDLMDVTTKEEYIDMVGKTMRRKGIKYLLDSSLTY